ncbi:DUF6134 family protein [Phenylobacterium sp.]|uniref:DUF6134 family protein n=1 Tax=Phenylobacterium sp. TaxID=1871053 RepID=UPI002FD9689A
MSADPGMTRRFALGAGLALALPSIAGAAAPGGGRLSFSVLRNGTKVGEHAMRFSRAGGLTTVTTEVEMRVRIGPVPVFRYTHSAEEAWREGVFQRLTTTTNSNGKIERVVAQRGDDGVAIEGPAGRVRAAQTAAPLTHWNREALNRPLFNPQLGKPLALRVSRAGRETIALDGGEQITAERWSLRGDAEIDNWYDSAGVWSGLRGKLEDGSTMVYRRV